MTQPGQDELELLRYCHSVYESLLARFREFRRAAPPDAVLAAVEGIARFAWFHHSGKFTEARLENVALEIGRTLGESSQQSGRMESTGSSDRGSGPGTLHVASRLRGVGGHARTIANWIRNDPDTGHCLVVTQQPSSDVPSWIEENVQASGGEVLTFSPETSLVEKSLMLRKIAGRGFQRVILHHHPDDVVPIVAFASASSPPVALVDHADHAFWIGASVADMVVCHRESAASLTTRRRGARPTFVLPIPLVHSVNSPARQAARTTLNISDDQVLLLSIGSSYKFAPTRHHNFFATASEVLESSPQSQLVLIGVTPEQSRCHAGGSIHERIHVLGELTELGTYQAAADVYLEGFPLGSQTAMLESALMATAIVPKHRPVANLFAGMSPALEGSLVHPPREEYVDAVRRLVDSAEFRTTQGRTVQEQVLQWHTGTAWRAQVQRLYGALDAMSHQVHPLDYGPGLETDDDIASSQARLIGSGRHPVDGTADWALAKMVCARGRSPARPRQPTQSRRIRRMAGRIWDLVSRYSSRL